jgi:hypothetical protein
MPTTSPIPYNPVALPAKDFEGTANATSMIGKNMAMVQNLVLFLERFFLAVRLEPDSTPLKTANSKHLTPTHWNFDTAMPGDRPWLEHSHSAGAIWARCVAVGVCAVAVVAAAVVRRGVPHGTMLYAVSGGCTESQQPSVSFIRLAPRTL